MPEWMQGFVQHLAAFIILLILVGAIYGVGKLRDMEQDNEIRRMEDEMNKRMKR